MADTGRVLMCWAPDKQQARIGLVCWMKLGNRGEKGEEERKQWQTNGRRETDVEGRCCLLLDLRGSNGVEGEAHEVR